MLKLLRCRPPNILGKPRWPSAAPQTEPRLAPPGRHQSSTGDRFAHKTACTHGVLPVARLVSWQPCAWAFLDSLFRLGRLSGRGAGAVSRFIGGLVRRRIVDRRQLRHQVAGMTAERRCLEFFFFRTVPSFISRALHGFSPSAYCEVRKPSRKHLPIAFLGALSATQRRGKT